MKPIKGLYSDNRPQEQPDGTYPFAKNGIQYDQHGSVLNEPGLRKIGEVVPYDLMGVIPTDGKPVVFSTDNTHSAIGFFNPVTELYEAIVDDSNWALAPAKLNFNKEFYITGEAQRNYKAELVVAFTDKSTFPKYLNCDNPSLASIDDMRLFPYFTPPTIAASQAIGGRAEPGTYYVAVGYERNDGTTTAYSAIGNLVILTPGQVEGVSDKALEIVVTHADTSFDNLRIAIISRIKGITRAVELTERIPISDGTINFLYTGDNLSADIDISEILVDPTVYSKVGAIGQLNDALYIGELEIDPDYNDLQLAANGAQVEFISELINAVSPPQEHVNGIKKSFMHEEVYALYIRCRKTRGGSTKWFTIPGNPLTVTGNSSEASAGGETVAVPKYKVEDTIPYFDAGDFSGGTGSWVNEQERYPNTPDFGTNANQLVRHHKMPSLRWCKSHFYNGNDTYGKTHLDLLGIRVTGFVVPDKYRGLISGYEIGYAKRSIGNMTIYGQSLLLHGISGNGSNSTSPIYTTGGNFVSDIIHGDIDTTDPRQLRVMRPDSFRFHGFDILFNKPSIQPTFISAQLKLHKGNIRNDGYIENGMHDDAELPIINLIDYTQGDAPRQVSVGQQLRKISESYYLTDNVNAYNFINARHENVFAGRLLGTSWPMNYSLSGFRANGGDTEVNRSLDFEETYLINLLAIKSDLYSSVFSQVIASAGTARSLSDSTPFWGGDTFVCPYTFHTYGRHETNDTHGDGFKGKKMVRRFVCESVSNIHLRYELAGNDYSKWYPRNTLTPSPLQDYMVYLDRSKDPNQFGYSKDFNALNDLNASIIYNPFREEITLFPFRIHRGGKNSRQNKPRSWRTFLPLDYYEMQKNMGRLIHLEGMDDKLLIHMENALFLTQDKATLQGGTIDVTLGSGDIFQFEPQPALGAKLGYGGTQHDLACVQTPVGYAFVDAKLGEVYLFKGQLKNLNPGLNNFFREYLKINGANVFTGNGITIGWDQKYKRILLTVKNKRIISSASLGRFHILNALTEDFFFTSVQEGDAVYWKGRYVQYVGVNDGTYDCPADPPAEVVTWQPEDPFCIAPNGINSGMKGWHTRRRYADGLITSYSEPNKRFNTFDAPYGPYIPPVLDLAACPLPAPVVTWDGHEPECLDNTTVSCSMGTLVGGVCVETATPTEYCLEGAPNADYGSYSTRLYKPGFSFASLSEYDLDDTQIYPEFDTNEWRNALFTTTDGPVNPYAVWTADCNTGTLAPPGVGTHVSARLVYNNTGLARQIHVGAAGDNEFTLTVNGTIIAQTNGSSSGTHFQVFHLFTCNLLVGQNEFLITGIGAGIVEAVAMVVYDNTVAQVLAAGSAGQSPADLTVLTSTDTLKREHAPSGVAAYGCATGWTLVNHGGTFSCERTSAPVTTSGSGNSGLVEYATRCRKINGIPDGFCEPNINGSGVGPYIQTFTDTGLCPLPVSGMQCGESMNENYAGNDFHAYTEQSIGIDAGTTVNFNWESHDRPNRFNIRKDGSTILTTGWKGYALYGGPWGASLPQTIENGTLTFLIEAGHSYSIMVEAGPADPNNQQSDNYNYQLNCK